VLGSSGFFRNFLFVAKLAIVHTKMWEISSQIWWRLETKNEVQISNNPSIFWLHTESQV
jgi:ribosomal protein L9